MDITRHERQQLADIVQREAEANELAEVKERILQQRELTRASLEEAQHHMQQMYEQLTHVLSDIVDLAERSESLDIVVDTQSATPMSEMKQELHAAASVFESLQTEMLQLDGYLSWVNRKIDEHANEINIAMNTVFSAIERRDTTRN